MSACYHCDGIIYEKTQKTGGHASSHEKSGFIFDEGIHVMHSKNEYKLSMMEKLNVKPENVVIIEDSLHGIQAALASGAAVIAKTGSVPESDLSIAHRIITHLDEITHNMIEDLLQGDK